MMKKLFFTLAVFLLALGINAGAQELLFSKSDIGNAPEQPVSKRIVKSKLTLAGNESWVGYWDGVNGDLRSAGAQSAPMGYDVAVRFPAGSPLMIDKRITGITFTFPDPTNIKNVKIWIAESEKGLPGNIILTQSVPEVTGLTNAEDPMNEIRFENPYTVEPDKEIFVGYSFDVAAGNSDAEKFPIATVIGLARTPNAMYLKFSGTEWADYTPFDFGLLAVRVLVQSTLSDNHVSVVPEAPEVYALKGKPFEIPVSLINTGTGFESVEGYIEIAGAKTPFAINAEPEITAKNEEYKFNLEMAAVAELGMYDYKIVVEKVNGFANSSDKNTSAGILKVMNSFPARKVVVENLTAFGCGLCPRGYVAEEKLIQTFGEKIIPVMAHIDEELGIEEYAPLNVGNLPVAMIDRTFAVDPYYGENNTEFGIRSVIEKAMDIVPDAEITVTPEPKASGIEAKADVTFVLPVKQPRYAVGFIVTEDGMTNPDWSQTNKLIELRGQGLEEREPLFEPWINGKSQRKGVIQNHIPIAVAGLFGGIEGTLPESVEEEVKYPVSYYIDLENNRLMQNPKNLSLIALLFDTVTGKIVNADKKALFGSDGVEESVIDENAVEIARYTTDGRRISQPVPGINIVRYSDGRAEKVLVR